MRKLFEENDIEPGDYSVLCAKFATKNHTHDAGDIVNTPAGNIAATNIQAAINELDTEKTSTSHTHAAGDGALITESAISLADNAINDASINKHGFCPKAPNDTTKFLRGDASWDAPVSFQVAEYTFNLIGNTIVPQNAQHDFGFVPKMVFGMLTNSDGTMITNFSIWINGYQGWNMPADGSGATGGSFLYLDSSRYLNGLSVNGTVLSWTWLNVYVSACNANLFAIG